MLPRTNSQLTVLSSLEYLDNSGFVSSWYAVFKKEEKHFAVRSVPKTHTKRI